MATVQKGAKINFYKFVPVKKVSGGAQAAKADSNVALTKTLNANTQAINNLGATVNSFAKVIADIKKINILELESERKKEKTFKAEYTQKKKGGFSAMILGLAKGTGSFFEGLMNMLGALLKAAIIIPALKWIGDPANREKVKNIIEGLSKIAKFIFDVAKFGVVNTIEGLYTLLSDESSPWEKLGGLVRGLVGLGTLIVGIRWLSNPLKIVTDFGGVLKFLYNNLVKGKAKLLASKGLGAMGGKVAVGAAGLWLLSEGVFTRSAADGTVEGNKDMPKGIVKGTEGIGPVMDGDRYGQVLDFINEEQKSVGGIVSTLKGFAQGGWISGPQSGYPVSLDGGRSTSFIGHGTEYVARKSNGGAFVVPFDTPATKTNPHLTNNRIGEAKRLGFFAEGGLVGSNKEKWAHMMGLGKNAGAKYPNLVAAQFALESAWGTALSGKNNFFGIKATGNEPATVHRTREVINGRDVYVNARFKDFNTPADAVNHLVTQWYKDYRGYKGVNNAENALAAADMLKTEGYATDPIYAKSLKRLLGEYADIRSAQVATPAPKPTGLDKGNPFQQFMRGLGFGEKAGNEGGRTPEAGSGNVVGVSHPDTGSGYGIQGQKDQSGRPLAFSRPAANAFARALRDSGMNLGAFVASSGRSDAKNKSIGGHPNSHHMYGEALDMNGEGYEWMRQHGKKYGWQYVYNHGPGSAHFKYVGTGAGSTPKLGSPGQKPSIGQAPPRENATVPASQSGGMFGAPARSTNERGAGGNFGGPSNADRISQLKKKKEEALLKRQTEERNQARRAVQERSQEMINAAMAAIAESNGINQNAIQQAAASVQRIISQSQNRPPIMISGGGSATSLGQGMKHSGGGSARSFGSTANKLKSHVNTLKGILS